MKLPDELLNDFLKKAEQLKDGPGRDFRENLQSLIQSQMSKLNLVSQEEFEIQQNVLAKTREKVEKMEKQLNELEQKLNNSQD